MTLANLEHLGQPMRYLAVADLPGDTADIMATDCAGIWCLGNMDLLGQPALSFAGMRRASDAGLIAAHRCAKRATELQQVCISGAAAGVDINAHCAALSAGGMTILVLAQGIRTFKINFALRQNWDWDRCLIVSQFSPDAEWMGRRAMQRNRLVIALGAALLIIEAGPTGGTRAAAEQATEIGRPVFALEYRRPVPGNQAVIAAGARPLGIRRDTGEPNIEAVLERPS